MIPLTAAQRTNVKTGYGHLGLRATSHLHKHGRSAGAGWQFLTGYTELLVQLEGGGKHSPEISPHLFLKNEGHPAVSVGHLLSYWHKLRHGAGNVANDAIQRVVKEQAQLGIDLGIAERAAENYSNAYQKVLDALGLAGATVTAQAAVVEMFTQCRVAAANKGQQLAAPLMTGLGMGGLQAAIAEHGVGGLDNAQMGAMIDNVLLPVAQAAAGIAFSDAKLVRVLGAMRDAEADLKTLAGHLRADAQRTGSERSVRYFQEIVVSPSAIDAGLAAAYQMLSA